HRAPLPDGPTRGLGYRRSRCDVPEVLLDLLPGLGHGNVAGEYEDGIGWPVIGAEPTPNVIDAGRLEVIHGADGAVGIGMPGRHCRTHDQVGRFRVGSIVALPLLVLDYRTLFVEFGLVDGTEKVPHAVALQPQDRIQCRLR